MYNLCIIYNSLRVTKMKSQNKKQKFIITKKIAKHGSQSIIVVPRILEKRLKPGTVVELSIDILEESNKKFGGNK